MFECHVRFERIFGKISEHVELQNWWILLYQSFPLHHSPGFWLVVPGKRRLGSSRNCVTMTAGNHHPHIRGQGQVLVFQQQFWSIFAVFLKENLTALYCLQKCERGFSTSSRAKVFSWLKLVWASSFTLKILLRPWSAGISFFIQLDISSFQSISGNVKLLLGERRFAYYSYSR